MEPQTGRDILARILEGSWVSLVVAVGSTLLSVVIGVVMGVVAGFYGGWVDSFISRLMDTFLAFPLLLFAISISASLQGNAFGMEGLTLRIAVLIFVIGFFSWPYIGRIVRAQTLSLREREFVEAARSLGARGPFILFRELLPNLIAPILVYATLLIPTNILFEAALSFLGVGIAPPQASWGGMLTQAVDLYEVGPDVHGHPRHGDLHHRAGLQSAGGRAARRTRPSWQVIAAVPHRTSEGAFLSMQNRKTTAAIADGRSGVARRIGVQRQRLGR